MAHTSSSIRFAQVLGLTTSGFLSGYIASFSLHAVSTISLSPPALRAKQWKRAYSLGSRTAPLLAVIASAACGYVTAHVGKHSPTFYAWLSCSILPVMIAPFTLTAMNHTNSRLHNKAATSLPDAVEDRDLEGLLRKWTALNSIRAVFPAAATALGLWVLTA